MNRLYQGDCLEKMKEIPSDTIDLILTDPPYGYSFMGKDWDKAIPSIRIWRECLRVLKPGAWCMVMSAPRQDVLSRMIINLENAGFRINFSSIYWAYATGFSKAGNIGKMIDRRLGAEREVIGKYKLPESNEWNLKQAEGRDDNPSPGTFTASGKRTLDITAPATDEAKILDGSYVGFQPKPAVEVIIVCMKPLSEKTSIDQALKDGKGITWLDDCKIPYGSEDDKSQATPQGKCTSKDKHTGAEPDAGNNENRVQFERPKQFGRFPANLLVSDDVLNDGKIRRGTVDKNLYRGETSSWFAKDHNRVSRGDSGSFSRYFDLDAWDKNARDTFPFIIVSKASKSEKNKGLDRLPKKQMYKCDSSGNSLEIFGTTDGGRKPRQNFHPTVKPLKLMRYLIVLTTRQGDVVADPFMGSGTTCIAAKELNRGFIGIELDEDYFKIAKNRIEQFTIQERLF